MNNSYKFEIPTEQGYDQVFIFTKKVDFQKFKNLLTNGGIDRIGNYSLRVDKDTITLYKSTEFDGPSYVMDRNKALNIVSNIK